MRGPVLLYVALTITLAYPLSLHPASTILPLGPEATWYMWTLGWDLHALIHQPLSIFDANIYYPLRHTLAYSENIIGSALVAAPVLWLTDDPLVAMNLVALATCVLCGLGAYVLARQLEIGRAGAIVSGIVFAFSPPRFFRLGQLHLTAIQWVPFALASLHAYLDRGRARDLRLAVAFFTLQALSSGHGTVFAALAMALLCVYRVARGEPIALTRRIRDFGLVGAILLLPAVLVYLPYVSVQREMGLRRSLENWTVTPISFLASPAHVPTFLLSLVRKGNVEDVANAYLFPGILPMVLAALAFFKFSHLKSSDPCVLKSSDSKWFYLLMTLLTIWLSIGPPIGLWPLVYWLPGFSFIRVPSRFTILGVLGLAVLSGLGVERLSAALPPRRRAIVVTGIGALLVLELAAMPLAVDPYRFELPEADRWLADQPKPFAIAEVPLGDPSHSRAYENRQTTYALHSMAHWQKTVNGYSSLRAPLHEELFAELLTFPDERSVESLRKLGVRYVVVHTEFYPSGEWEKVEPRLAAFWPRLRLEHIAGRGRVYSLRTSP